MLQPLVGPQPVERLGKVLAAVDDCGLDVHGSSSLVNVALVAVVGLEAPDIILGLFPLERALGGDDGGERLMDIGRHGGGIAADVEMPAFVQQIGRASCRERVCPYG